MVNGTKTSDVRGLNNGRCSDFRVDSEFEEGQWTYLPKRWEYKNKDEDSSPETLTVFYSLRVFLASISW